MIPKYTVITNVGVRGSNGTTTSYEELTPIYYQIYITL